MLNRKKQKPAPVSGRQRKSRLQAEKPSAFSYYSRRSEEMLGTGRKIARTETAERTRQVTRYWRQRFGLGALLISAILCAVYITTLTTNPRVEVISQSGESSLQDLNIYKSAAQQLLAESVTNQNKITISTTSLSNKMLAKFPELNQVQVSLPLLNHRVQLGLIPAEPILLLATSSGSYALDSRGIALATGSRLADFSDLQLPLVTDDSNLELALRKQALTADNATFIAGIAAYLKAQNLTIVAMTLPAGSNELHVRLADQPYYVKFNLANNNSRQQAGTLIAVYDRLKAQAITPGEYIDVRVDGRAYYR